MEPAHQRHRGQSPDCRGDRPDTGRLQDVHRPVRPRLGGESHVQRALAHPGADREVHDHQQQRDAGSGGGAAEERPRLEPAEQAPRRAPDEHAQRAQLHTEGGEPEDALEAAVILCPVELKGREVLLGVDRGGLDQAAAWPEQESRGSRGGHRHRDRKWQPRTPHYSTL
jgi:hypothetical protein